LNHGRNTGSSAAIVAGVSAADETTSPAESSIYVQTTTARKLAGSLPRNIYEGQRDFWTMPLRFRLNDAFWGVPFGITTGALIAADTSIQKELPTDPNTIKRFDNISNYGAMAFGGLVGGSYLLGKAKHNTYLSDTAWLAGEAGLNGLITTYALKSILGRQRPDEGNGQGDFFSGGQSFPSEHATAAWSVATVFANRYPSFWTKFFMYGGASTMTASRVLGRRHFASDTFVASALGWYFGHQAVKRYERQHSTDAMYGKFVRSTDSPAENSANMGSPYVPLDSWVYPVFDRLSALGYIQTAFAGLRPWTRLECARLLQEAIDRSQGFDRNGIADPEISALRTEFSDELPLLGGGQNIYARVESLYTRVTTISGQPLTDGYHFGQTIYNDYGRPYQEGFNNVTGISGSAVAGPFAVYVRGEYQHAPGAPALPDNVRAAVAAADYQLPIPSAAPIASINRFRLLDAYISFTRGGWQTLFGKQTVWWGPDLGGDLLYSNNAEPVLMARFTRVTPFKLPFLLSWMGPIRTDFFFGQLQGQEFVRLGQEFNDLQGSYGTALDPQPFIMGYKLSFKPTPNLELGFSLTDVFAGFGRPLTFKNFFHEFSTRGSSVSPNTGDRRTGFDFRYRVPGLRRWLVLYNGSMSEDEINPIAYPRRSAMNPGIYIPQVPKIPKLDLRAEGIYTDLPGLRSTGYYYINQSYPDGYRNYGNILGSWVGRQGRGIQAWARYWFSAQTNLQFGYRKQGVSPDFLEGGTVHDFTAQADVLLRPDLSMRTSVQYEHWNFPMLSTAPRSNVTTSFEFVFRPSLGRKY
jgi:membrane-associated phospholipid phosphatase